MISLLITMLIALLGADHFVVREEAQMWLTYVVTTTECDRQVRAGMKVGADCEIRWRCAQIWRGYSHIDIPANMGLYQFDSKTDPQLWSVANRLPVYADAREFIRLLVEEKNMKPRVVRHLVEGTLLRIAIQRAINEYRSRLTDLGVPYSILYKPRPSCFGG